jgi:nucleotide-binding universal stress UspA family protein
MSAIAQATSINPLKTQSFPRIQQLLFATDFSDASRAALPFAAAIADTFKSELHLLHLLMPEAYRYLPPERIPASVNSLEDDAQRAMQDLRNSVLLRGIRLTSEVAKGELGLLLRRIGDRDIDMLVIGTHGRQGFRRLLLGSIAEEIIRHAPCPVLTVGPHAKHVNGREFRPKHVLFATDASPDSFRALPYAVLFAMKQCSDLTMVHVLPKSREAAPDVDAYVALMHDALYHTIPLMAIKGCSPEILVKFGDPAEQILQAADERGCELIVMGARSESVKLENIRSKGVSYGVIAGATCPVLTVRGRDS